MTAYIKRLESEARKAKFPFYIRRSIYFIERYFIPIKPGALFRKLRVIWLKTGSLSEKDLKPFLKSHNFKETPEKYRLDCFLDNMFSQYRIGDICEALQNLDRYANLDYPENFKLLEGHADYLGTRPDGYDLLN